MAEKPTLLTELLDSANISDNLKELRELEVSSDRELLQGSRFALNMLVPLQDCLRRSLQYDQDALRTTAIALLNRLGATAPEVIRAALLPQPQTDVAPVEYNPY